MRNGQILKDQLLVAKYYLQKMVLGGLSNILGVSYQLSTNLTRARRGDQHCA